MCNVLARELRTEGLEVRLVGLGSDFSKGYHVRSWTSSARIRGASANGLDGYRNAMDILHLFTISPAVVLSNFQPPTLLTVLSSEFPRLTNEVEDERLQACPKD